MKIGICGASGTGKTEYAKKKAEMYGLHLISGLIRDKQKELNIDWREIRKNPAEYLKWQNLILDVQIQEESKHESFISDRTTLDYVPYVLLHCQECKTEDIDYFIKRAILNSIKYTEIWYIQFHTNFLKNDGVRDTSINYNMLWDSILGGVLYEQNTLQNKIRKIDYEYLLR